MRSTCLKLVCVSTLLLATAAAHADIVNFSTIPGAASANDMSPDGRYIVGKTNAGQPYIYDSATGVMSILPASGASDAVAAVSDNGQVVLGTMLDAEGRMVAGMYTVGSNAWTSLGFLPNSLACPSHSNGYELSADGSVATGLSWDGCSGRGFRWTQATGMVELQNLANGGNRASVVSADGNVIGGFAQGSFSRTPAIWTADGSGQLLDPPNGDDLGEVHGINDAGTLLLIERNGKAVTCTFPGLAITQIGGGSALPGWRGIPSDIANNGMVVGFDILGGNRRAWIHPAGPGPCIDLTNYINANGGSVPEGTVLEVCQAVSADGKTIIGHGFTGMWIVRIDSTLCPADLTQDNVVNVSDMLALIGDWGPCPGTCPPRCAADIAPVSASSLGDCIVNVSDLLGLISKWGACPQPSGGCCIAGSCQQLTQAACASAGGVYLGDSAPCTATACSNNDSCASPVNITNKINGAAQLGDNSTATPPIFGGGDPQLPAGSPSCHWNTNPASVHSTVWYSFVAPANGKVTIGLCNTVPQPFVDSVMALYSGTCGALEEVTCDEDACAGDDVYPFFSRIVAEELMPGATYRVAVMNPGDWSGSVPGPFVLNITSP